MGDYPSVPRVYGPRYGSRLAHGHAHTCDHVRWSRRDFLRSLGLAATGTAFAWGSRAVQAFGQPVPAHRLPADDRVLVLLQLDGGNDGLNTLVPFEDALYYRARPTLALPKTQIVAIAPDLGFHPSLASLAPVFAEGDMAVVQNVGYTRPDLSHFRSTDIWTTASDADVALQTGWVGRYIHEVTPDFRASPPQHPIAVQIGGPSLMFQGPDTNMGMAIRDLGRFESLVEEGRFYSLADVPPTVYGDEMGYLRDVANAAFRYAGAIQEAGTRGNNSVAYPDNPLAASLRVVAQLIKGGLETKIYVVSLGGFDTHADQADLHAQLLRYLAESVTVFLSDFAGDSRRDNLLVMTFSEFGRRVYENGSLGTDHGTSAPLFFFGRPVQGGMYGRRAALDDLDAGGNPIYDIEFRHIYATVLQDWFGLPPAASDALLGGPFEALSVLTGPTGTATEAADLPDGFTLHPNYPNPFNPHTMIAYALARPSTVRLTVFDAQGRRVRTLVDGHQGAGAYEVVFRGEGLPSGTYHYRLQTEAGVRSRSMLLLK